MMRSLRFLECQNQVGNQSGMFHQVKRALSFEMESMMDWLIFIVLGDSVRITFSDFSFVMYYGIPGYGVSRSNAENDIYKEQNWDMGKWDEDRMRDAYYFIR